jgi:hypothetical protein
VVKILVVGGLFCLLRRVVWFVYLFCCVTRLVPRRESLVVGIPERFGRGRLGELVWCLVWLSSRFSSQCADCFVRISVLVRGLPWRRSVGGCCLSARIAMALEYRSFPS